MFRYLVLSIGLTVLASANVALYAACSKCCGGDYVLDTSHRECDEEGQFPTGLCHVTECSSNLFCGECWSSSDTINDNCDPSYSGDWGRHNCGL